MNRCRRCATVITGMIAAGALYAGVGVAVATPAWSDPVESRETAGIGTAGRDTRVDDDAVSAPRSRVRSASPAKPVPKASRHRDRRVFAGPVRPKPDGTEGEAHHEWPCPWSPITPIIVPTGQSSRPEAGGGGGGIVFLNALVLPPPVAQLVVGPAPTPGLVPIPGLDPTPAGQPAAPAEQPALPAADGAPASSPPAPTGAEQSAAVPLAGPPSRPPAPRSPQAGTQPPDSVRLGYPEYLRQADVAQLASVALPGLAAILGLTALGGLLGYRQAKAGYLLPAAGAARFVR